ncbi:MAG: lytic transglycosylase domain-containing protein [Proteobacteria bacterium]|nr:lytic transglycosylase domain-containing protein [Pseudomonadota bacterium]
MFDIRKSLEAGRSIFLLLFFVLSVSLVSASFWFATSAYSGADSDGAKGISESAVQLDYITTILAESRTGLSPEEERELAAVILEVSDAYSVDPLLVMAIIETESTYYNRARSHKGAIGLMQIMPDTGVWVAGMLDVDWQGSSTLYDPQTNVRLGTRYFSMLKKRFDNDTHLSLAAYNAGPTRVSRSIRRGQRTPVRYAEKVLKSYKEHRDGFSEAGPEQMKG